MTEAETVFHAIIHEAVDGNIRATIYVTERGMGDPKDYTPDHQMFPSADDAHQWIMDSGRQLGVRSVWINRRYDVPASAGGTEAG